MTERSELRGPLYAFPVLKDLGSIVEVVSAGLLSEGFVRGVVILVVCWEDLKEWCGDMELQRWGFNPSLQLWIVKFIEATLLFAE